MAEPSDAALAREMVCFGRSFSLTADGGSCVRECDVVRRCVTRMAGVGLDLEERRAGRRLTDDEAARACITDTASVSWVRRLKAGLVTVEELIQRVTPEAPPVPTPPPAQPQTADAFGRERARSAFVGGLRHGQVLVRVVRRKVVARVTVDLEARCYRSGRRRYPTLYALVLERGGATRTPAGKLTAKYSVQRFFQGGGAP